MTRTILTALVLLCAGVLVYRRHRQEQRESLTMAERKGQAWGKLTPKYRYRPGMEQASSQVRQAPWWVRRKRSA